MESQKEMLKLLRSETGENVRDNTVEETESETRNFYTPTKTVLINSTQKNDPCSSRNNELRTIEVSPASSELRYELDKNQMVF